MKHLISHLGQSGEKVTSGTGTNSVSQSLSQLRDSSGAFNQSLLQSGENAINDTGKQSVSQSVKKG